MRCICGSQVHVRRRSKANPKEQPREGCPEPWEPSPAFPTAGDLPSGSDGQQLSADAQALDQKQTAEPLFTKESESVFPEWVEHYFLKRPIT